MTLSAFRTAKAHGLASGVNLETDNFLTTRPGSDIVFQKKYRQPDINFARLSFSRGD